MSTLPEPQFVARDGEAILAECVAAFEAATQEPLAPASRDRLLIDLLAFRETLLRVAIQEAAKQNLLAYALWPMIDYLGQLLGVPRLDAAPSVTTFEFALAIPPVGVDVDVPAGTKIRTEDGLFTFETLEDAVIVHGTESVQVDARCTSPGSAANGYLPGQVKVLVGLLAYPVSVANLTTTADGRDQEDTEAYRARLSSTSPTSSSVAGPTQAYARLARAAHGSIVDVHVGNPEPGVVRVTLLGETGAPDAGVLTIVEQALSAETVRPLTDTVEVAAAEEFGYDIDVSFSLKRSAFPVVPDDLFATWESIVMARAVAFDAEVSGKLGVDLVLGTLIRKLGSDEIYDIQIASPSSSSPVDATAFFKAASINVTCTGFEDSE